MTTTSRRLQDPATSGTGDQTRDCCSHDATRAVAGTRYRDRRILRSGPRTDTIAPRQEACHRPDGLRGAPDPRCTLHANTRRDPITHSLSAGSSLEDRTQGTAGSHGVAGGRVTTYRHAGSAPIFVPHHTARCITTHMLTRPHGRDLGDIACTCAWTWSYARRVQPVGRRRRASLHAHLMACRWQYDMGAG